MVPVAGPVVSTTADRPGTRRAVIRGRGHAGGLTRVHGVGSAGYQIPGMPPGEAEMTLSRFGDDPTDEGEEGGQALVEALAGRPNDPPGADGHNTQDVNCIHERRVPAQQPRRLAGQQGLTARRARQSWRWVAITGSCRTASAGHPDRVGAPPLAGPRA